ncbi:MAG: sugar phosphate isomerase/epimerase family protein [Actinomycetaceae bacterium]|nr:sugar phosphate isomerase/epimerase family protein [Actinomycetaceae bacterium]
MKSKDPVAITTDYGGETTSIEKLRESLKAVADAGFSHIHWCNEWDSEYIYSNAEMLQIKSWLDAFGLQVEGIHASEGVHRPEIAGKFHLRNRYQNRKDYTSFDEFNRQAGVELILNRLQMANVFETDTIVLHMQLPYAEFTSQDFREKYYHAVKSSLHELEMNKERGHVKICIENMIGTPNDEQFKQFDFLFAEFSSDFLGFCYDIGHEHITTDPNSEPFPFLSRYGNRLFAVHFSDNLGLLHDQCWNDDPEMTKCDLHLLPYKGTIDYQAALAKFSSSAFSGAVTLEVSQRNRNRAEFLSEALTSAKTISQTIRKFRGV